MSSSAKGKGRAVDSDNSDQEQDPGSDSGHQRPSSTSQPTNKSKSKSQLRAALDEEGEVRPTLAEHLDNEANWTPEEKAKRERKTRADYRKLQLEIEGDRHNLIDTTVDQLGARVAAANKLFKTVRRPAEAVLDSKVLLTASDAGALKARQLKLDANAFDTDEFIVKLAHFMGGRTTGARKRRREVGDSDDELDEEEEDPSQTQGGGGGLRWELVGQVLNAESRRAASMDFMYGPLEAEAKVRVARKERQKANVKESEKTKPLDLEVEDITKNPKETTKMVADISDILENIGESAIPYLHFVTNPDSFAQTVENMFYFSFLVKEGKASIELDDNEDSEHFGEYVAFRCEPPTEEDKANNNNTTSQLVFELTQDIWRSAIEGYSITHPIIPTRKQEVLAPGARKAKW